MGMGRRIITEEDVISRAERHQLAVKALRELDPAEARRLLDSEYPKEVPEEAQERAEPEEEEEPKWSHAVHRLGMGLTFSPAVGLAVGAPTYLLPVLFAADCSRPLR